MAKNKYGMQKPLQNDLQQCINSFERMKCGGIGIADELVCDTCKRALKYIDALEAKLAESKPVRHGHWVSEYDCGYITPHCSECGETALTKEETSYDYVYSSYCPRCGAKMDKTE